MRKEKRPIFDGEYCSEWPLGKTCPHLVYVEDCDTMCAKHEKVPHPVWDGKNKNFRLSRCPQCRADEKELANA